VCLARRETQSEKTREKTSHRTMSTAATVDAKGAKQPVVELVEDDDEFEEFETGSLNLFGMIFFLMRRFCHDCL
jgi:hypothetical protein